ncbi:MAG TPA: DUF1906 domain-containing protein [Solirubrobacteraceae bacterium]|nr:DUF1906 domain-containing protein [Solirubrobacteraceae bacterium]
MPATWPVFHLTRAPRTCVRFDRHAVYLGTPSGRQNCPAHAAGHTEAVLVRPLAAAAASAGPRGSAEAPSEGAVDSFTVPARGIVVIATWSRARRMLATGLRHALRPAAVTGPAGAARTRAAQASAGGARASRASRPAGTFRSDAVTWTGRGFDACSAPSPSVMSAWSGSPYRGIGVYIGGANSACAQPNLTASWVSAEAAAGWHLIPTYVGLQAPGACSGSCVSIDPTQASTQGSQAAADAVNQVRNLGMPAGSPIYFDMEQYSRTTNNTNAVLSFLSGWTQALHASGYQSGVYSSASSGISDLVSQYGTGYAEPDDIWIAHWDGQATTNDAYVPSTDWPGSTRLRQYQGGHNETYGGATLNIDSDYLNGATATGAPASPFPDGTFVEAQGDPNVYRIAGGAAMLVSSWAPFGGAQPVTMTTSAQLAALPAYPINGTFVTSTAGQSYRIAGGTPFPVTDWSLYAGQQPSVTIDAWDLQNIGNPLDHLTATPLDGTLVQGLPSGRFWSFATGTRSAAQANPGATGVEDQALSPFAIVAHTGGVGTSVAVVNCTAPRLKHLSLVRARGALRKAHCRLGRVRRPRRWGRHHLLRVFGQSVRPGSAHPSGYRINIRLL